MYMKTSFLKAKVLQLSQCKAENTWIMVQMLPISVVGSMPCFLKIPALGE